MRDRKKLIWTVGVGAVSSAGRPERTWFVRLFRVLCDKLELQMWAYVTVLFENVLWTDELDNNGVTLWEEMQTI